MVNQDLSLYLYLLYWNNRERGKGGKLFKFTPRNIHNKYHNKRDYDPLESFESPDKGRCSQVGKTGEYQ